MVITKDKFAAFHYTLKDSDGNKLDSSLDTEPLGYIHGRGYLIPGLEAQLEGKTEGERFSCTIEPKDAYGERDERLVARVSRDKFETDAPIELGMQFQVVTPAGPSIVTVVNVDGDTITIDGNHEMAGKTLNFDIDIVNVRDATPEEIQQLEMRGCGGCGGCGGECGNNCEGGCGNDCGAECNNDCSEGCCGK